MRNKWKSGENEEQMEERREGGTNGREERMRNKWKRGENEEQMEERRE